MTCILFIKPKRHCRFKRINKQKTSSRASTTSTISTRCIEHIIKNLKQQRHRQSIRQNYHRISKIFSRFYLRLDVKPKTWPERLTLFVGYLIDNKKQSATVRSYVSAIKAILENDGIKFDTDVTTITSLTQVCKYVNDKAHKRSPIQKSLLIKIIKTSNAHTSYNLTNV